MLRRQTRIGVGPLPGQSEAPKTEVRPKAKRGAPAEAPGDNDPSSGVLLRHARLTGVQRLALPLSDLMAMQLDHRAGFLISLVDGSYTLEMILDACAMKRDDALAILAELAARRIIIID